MPPGWGGLWQQPLARSAAPTVYAHGVDAYDPARDRLRGELSPAAGPAALAAEAEGGVFSLGAGVDGFLLDPDFPEAHSR